jgi:hypothetical protein
VKQPAKTALKTALNQEMTEHQGHEQTPPDESASPITARILEAIAN